MNNIKKSGLALLTIITSTVYAPKIGAMQQNAQLARIPETLQTLQALTSQAQTSTGQAVERLRNMLNQNPGIVRAMNKFLTLPPVIFPDIMPILINNFRNNNNLAPAPSIEEFEAYQQQKNVELLPPPLKDFEEYLQSKKQNTKKMAPRVTPGMTTKLVQQAIGKSKIALNTLQDYANRGWKLVKNGQNWTLEPIARFDRRVSPVTVAVVNGIITYRYKVKQ